MLKHLYIRNYALIKELDIDLHQGFSVITGETGAGKSILLGAIGLLLGQRADSKAIQQGAQKCVIEAIFDIRNYALDNFFQENELDFDGQECTIRRELTVTGKSRSFINDSPVNVTQLRQLGSKLIDIHSQHQNLLLGTEDFQLNIIDSIAKCQEKVQTYRQAYAEMKSLATQLRQAREEAKRNQDDEEYLSYQVQQLQELNPQPGEDEELEQEARILSHAEDIKSALYEAEATLSDDESGTICTLKKALQSLQRVTSLYEDASELAERLDSSLIELKDIESELSDHMERIDFNPQRLEAINDRLNTLYELEQKHHVGNADELITLYQELQQKLEHISNADEYIAQLETAYEKAYQKTVEEAGKLTMLRTETAKGMEEGVNKRLVPLGIPNAQFRIDIKALESPSENGMDGITFLFSANKNSALSPISQVASGGEISRIMLTLKALLSKSAHLPTIIFDEIDTGVSGRIAECMAETMQEMSADGHQIISITHLPQIAAKGTSHYLVYKEDTDDQTLSHICELAPEDRIQEIAHMLSGADLSQAAIENAKQLLKI